MKFLLQDEGQIVYEAKPGVSVEDAIDEAIELSSTMGPIAFFHMGILITVRSNSNARIILRDWEKMRRLIDGRNPMVGPYPKP